jgi:hypothetical protein
MNSRAFLQKAFVGFKAATDLKRSHTICGSVNQLLRNLGQLRRQPHAGRQSREGRRPPLCPASGHRRAKVRHEGFSNIRLSALVSGQWKRGVERRNFDSNFYVVVDIEKISVQSLRKTGIFPSQAGDFRGILAEVVHFQRPNKRAIMQE